MLKMNNRQITGNVGLYYVSYKLSRMGWNVMTTSRNAKGVDIMAYNEDVKIIHKIQVKSYTERQAISFGNKVEIFSDFYVIVTYVYKKPVVYLLKGSEVEPLIRKQKEQNWLEIEDYEKNEFLENWEKIGCGWVEKEKCDSIRKIDNERGKVSEV